MGNGDKDKYVLDFIKMIILNLRDKFTLKNIQKEVSEYIIRENSSSGQERNKNKRMVVGYTCSTPYSSVRLHKLETGLIGIMHKVQNLGEIPAEKKAEHIG